MAQNPELHQQVEWKFLPVGDRMTFQFAGTFLYTARAFADQGVRRISQEQRPAGSYEWLASVAYPCDYRRSWKLADWSITLPIMNEPNDDLRLVENSLLYKMFARQRDEILRYKWIESEKAGVDIGFEKALLGWLINHRGAWQEHRQPGVC